MSKFSALSSQWWRDPLNGPFAGLHAMNAVRVPLIRRAMRNDFLPGRGLVTPDAALPLLGLSVLDVGCGGGILSEALARLGATVTGLDASQSNVEAARAHAAGDPALGGRLHYLCSTAEALAAEGARYHGVVCSEVVEHVASPAPFLATLTTLLRPGGHLVLTTINRTQASFWGAIVGAEYVLRLVPPGTHEWAKFVTPGEVQGVLEGQGLRVEKVTGLFYDPLFQRWGTTERLDINYAIVAMKPQLEGREEEAEEEEEEGGGGGGGVGGLKK